MSSHRCRFLSFLVVFIFHIPQLVLAFTHVFPPDHDNTTTQILDGVLKEIWLKQGWDLEGIKIYKLEVDKIRIGSAQRFEFKIRFGKSYMLFKFPDEVNSWKKFGNASSSIGFGDLIKDFGPKVALGSFKLEGPFDLWVSGHDHLSLSLPMTPPHIGLKRVLVGEGITVEVKGAKEVSLFHDFGLNFAVNGSIIRNKGGNGFYPFWDLMCMPLLPVRVIGSGSLVAYRNQNPDATIETTFLWKDTIKLLPEKCYGRNARKNQACSIHSLSSRIASLEKILSSLLGDRTTQNELSRFFRASVKASTIIRFQLEMEKSFGSNDTFPGMSLEWRTRPTVERIWFDVMARVEGEKLKPIMVKKVRPFITVDTASWSNLMSNISFTNFPSVLVPPEALTLDVKW